MDHVFKVFVTVVEKKSLSRAAEKLFITQSAVSQNIKMLEKKYHCKLLERTNKYVRVTKAGGILYDHARRVLNELTLIERLIEDLKESPSGALLIGSGFTYGEYILPDLISMFITQYPDINPKITIKNSVRIAKQVEQKDLDIGIVERNITINNGVTVPFAEDEMVVIVPYDFPYGHKEEVHIKELDEMRWIIRETGSGTREVTDYMFNYFGITPMDNLEFGSTQLIKEAVINGMGISYISRSTVQKELELGSLKEVKIQGYQDTRKFYYITNSSQSHTKATDLFINFLV